MPKNRHNINLLWLKFTLLIIAGILLFNSCRTTSRVVVSEKADIDEKKLEKKHLNRLGVIKHMWIKKFSGELQIGDQVHQLKGNIRLVKDSIMIIGIQSAMGVEAIRIYLGQDSILVMNRLNRTYYYEPVHKIKNELNTFVGLSWLQDILLSNAKRLTNNVWTGGNMKQATLKDGYLCISPRGHPNDPDFLDGRTLLKNACFYEDNMMLQSAVYKNEPDDLVVGLSYGTYEVNNLIDLPGRIEFEVQKNGRTDFGLHVIINRVETNIPFSTMARIGKNYKKIRYLSEM